MMRSPISILAGSIVLAVALSSVSPSAAGEPILQNGDVNGDGAIDLSDAVYLLQSMFLDGPPPVAITCPQCPDPCPPAPTAQVRLLNDLTCNGGSTTASLDLCGASVSRATLPTSSDCKEVAFTGSVCHAEVRLSTACGTLDFCAEIPFAEGHVYDVVAYFNSATQSPAAMWFDRTLDEGGACPTFPTPSDLQTGNFGNCASGGEVSEAGGLGSSEGLWDGR
jgi:hypothetical protein